MCNTGGIMAAIGNQFDAERAADSQSYAYKCWYNYNYERNTMRISAQEMTSIVKQYQNEISNWEANAVEDTNAYEIDDDDWTTASLEGEKKAEETAGHDGDRTNANKRSAAVNTTAAVGVAATAVTVGVTTANFWGSISVGAAFGIYVACPLALATGILYEALKPNKKEHQALMELEELLKIGQGNLNTSQLQLDQIDNEIVEQGEELEETQEESQKEIEAKIKLYETAMAIYLQLVTRAESGTEEFTEEDKARLQACGESLKILGKEVAVLQATSADSVEESYDDMEAKQADFDEQATSIATEEGIADFTESFDQATRNSAILTATAQSANVAMGLLFGAIALAQSVKGVAIDFVCLALSAAGFAGAGMSAHGVVEQSKFAHNIGKEIEVRENTQDLVVETYDYYDGKLSSFDEHLTVVSETELEVPEELIALQDFEVATVDVSEPTEEAPNENFILTENPSENSNNPFAPKEKKPKEESSQNPFA
jgi:hypothetical protein